jgi:NADPH:quinone reductase
MKAIITGKDRSLKWQDVPDPIMGDDEVLIEVHAAALNRADLMQRNGEYPPPPGCPEWMGLEVSGIVKKIGKKALEESSWKTGDQVCALLGGGGYAEYAAVRHDMLMPVPKGVSLIEAAAIPEAFATAYLNLFIEGKAKPGETLLMHAGASGLASVVIPMAKSSGLRVITSVLSDRKAQSIKRLKPDVIINTATQDTSEILKRQKEAGYPVDLAIDCLGGEMLGKCLPCMAREGRWIVIATLAGDTTTVDLRSLHITGISLMGTTLRSRTLDVKAKILAELVRSFWPKVESGQVRPTIYKVLPITEAAEAHKILENGENIGKVVLTVPH